MDEFRSEDTQEKRIGLKTLLEKNKIYFETIVPLSISIVAIVVSLVSYNLSQRQFSLAELSVKPDLYVKESLIFNDSNIVESSVLQIFNSGHPVTKIGKSIHSILIVEFWSKSGKHHIYIPVSGYYDGSSKTGDLKGELVNAFGYNNRLLLAQLHYETLTPNFRDRFGSVFIEVKHAISVSYQTKIGNMEEQFFIGTQPVPKNKYDELNEHYDPFSLVDLTTISAEYIGQKINEEKDKQLKTDS